MSSLVVLGAGRGAGLGVSFFFLGAGLGGSLRGLGLGLGGSGFFSSFFSSFFSLALANADTGILRILPPIRRVIYLGFSSFPSFFWVLV